MARESQQSMELHTTEVLSMHAHTHACSLGLEDGTARGEAGVESIVCATQASLSSVHPTAERSRVRSSKGWSVGSEYTRCQTY